MSRSVSAGFLRALTLTLTLTLALGAPGALAQGKFPGIGRAATPEEVRAWDIDVRTDFKGLPVGSGSVAKGQQVWEGKCASCHGVFGESNEFFTPIVGGVTAEDVKRGRVAALIGKPELQRTTLMKMSSIATLWDYINRAMPWNTPKSLSVEEVYAVTAFILNLGEILPDSFVLSDKNIGEVQKLVPNRNGMTRKHGLWEAGGSADVKNTLCMKDCPVGVHGQLQITSSIPDYARDAHGNLADQNRPVGPVRGVVTGKGAVARAASAVGDPRALANSSNCLACHATDRKVVGPSFIDIAGRYKGDSAAPARLAARIKDGGVGAWGNVPMPPHAGVKSEEIELLVRWILSGAGPN